PIPPRVRNDPLKNMAGRKKMFSCGHFGKGRFCHRCVQEETQKQKSVQAKSDWNDRLSASPVQLDHLPKDAAEKTLQVIKDLTNGKRYQDFKGKRMITIGQREVISIPVGRHFRLI
ncbi:MAG: hypothetical protein ACE5FH_12065, partial [Candidatus Zixiibacteriota bacterium]